MTDSGPDLEFFDYNDNVQALLDCSPGPPTDAADTEQALLDCSPQRPPAADDEAASIDR